MNCKWRDGQGGEAGACHGLRHFSLALLLCASGGAFALDVGLAGVFPNKAVLVLGGAVRTVAVGARTPEGVKLLAVEGDTALVEMDGQKQRLTLGAHSAGAGEGTAPQEVRLIADGHGQFMTAGTINGRSVSFLVDTGASMVSLGIGDARRLGINYSNGRPGYSQTANGTAKVWQVKLDRIKVGSIEINNVDGLVHEQDMPFALLGMSFLNRMEMKRDGDTMTLRRRF